MSTSDVVVDGVTDMHLGDGPISFKLIFNPKKHRNCHNIDICVQDSFGGQAVLDVSRWGTKMRVVAEFPNTYSEGISRIIVKNGSTTTEVKRFWFVR